MAAACGRQRHPAASWRFKLVLALLPIFLLLSGCGATSQGESTDPLRWPPPALFSPTVVNLGGGYSNVHLGPSEDATINLPAADKRGGVTIEGGHNVVLIGGRITVPSDQPPGVENDRFRTGVYIKGATGIVHVEGLQLDGAPGAVWDAIDINAPAATVQLENIRVDGVRGRFHGFHGDVVQTWGGVRDLRINRLTASSNYQGLTISVDRGPIGQAELSKVNLRGLSRHVEKGGHLIWVTSGTETCRTYPLELRGVFLEPRRGLTLGQSVWPQVGRPRRCQARVRKNAATWPRLDRVEGEVRGGSPADGAFVPTGSVGSDYVSPGYRAASGQ
jgi:hypothetical protein